jgi:hypothetical protein
MADIRRQISLGRRTRTGRTILTWQTSDLRPQIS